MYDRASGGIVKYRLLRAGSTPIMENVDIGAILSYIRGEEIINASYSIPYKIEKIMPSEKENT